MPPVPEVASRAPELHLVFHADPDSVRQSLTQMLGLPPLSGLSAEDRGISELVLAEERRPAGCAALRHHCRNGRTRRLTQTHASGENAATGV